MEEGVRERGKKKIQPKEEIEDDIPQEREDKFGRKPNDSKAIDIILAITIVFFTAIKLLNNIEWPASIVWDETHFTKFSTWYFTGHYFVDIHPPLAKLIMALVIWFSGYQSLNEVDVEWWTQNGFVGTTDYENIYNGYTYIAVRQASVVAGLFLVVCIYWLMRSLGCSRFVTFFTCWMVVFDNLITLYSRLILTDIYLWLFHVATIAASFTSTRSNLTFREQVFWCSVTGFFLGCVISVKYTGLGCVGFIGVHQFISVIYAHRQVWSTKLSIDQREFILHKLYVKMAIKAFIILSIMITVFVSIWMIHISILPYQGQGDGFMEERFQATLVPFQSKELIEQAKLGGCPNHANSWLDCGYPTISEDECIERGCCWDPTSKSKWCYFSHYTKPTPKHLSMFTKIRMVLHATWANNQGEELNEHPTMSRWWEWPFLTGKLVDYGFGIYSVGNVVVWYLSAITVILCTVLLPVLVFTKSIDAVSSLKIFSLLTGYYGCLLPFYLIVRSTWNYHYTLALLFGIVLTGYVFDLLLRSKKLRNVALITMLALMAIIVYGFYHYYSFTYGSTKTHSQNLELRLFEKWIA